MILRELTLLDKESYEKYYNSWKNEEIIPKNTDLKNYDSFEDMVEKLSLSKMNKTNLLVPNTTLFLFHKSEILGAVNIRFRLNEDLEKHGGHINFGVTPKARGNGYSRFMTRYAIDYLESLGVDEVLLNADIKNAPSIKTILKNNSVEIEPLQEGERKVCRFWINRH